jgi:hypothetical protein
VVSSSHVFSSFFVINNNNYYSSSKTHVCIANVRTKLSRRPKPRKQTDEPPPLGSRRNGAERPEPRGCKAPAYSTVTVSSLGRCRRHTV